MSENFWYTYRLRELSKVGRLEIEDVLISLLLEEWLHEAGFDHHADKFDGFSEIGSTAGIKTVQHTVGGVVVFSDDSEGLPEANYL